MELFTTRLDSPESRPFGLVGAELLAIASTGEMAVSLGRRAQGGFTRVGMLARLGMTGGGAPKDVREDVLYADWSPDGKDLVVVRDAGGKSQLEYPIGKVLYSSAGWLSHPRVSPSGDEIAVIEHPTIDDDGGYVLLLDRSGQSKKISGDFASILGLCWEKTGRRGLVHRVADRLQPVRPRGHAFRRGSGPRGRDRRHDDRGRVAHGPGAALAGQGAAGNRRPRSGHGEGARPVLARLVARRGHLERTGARSSSTRAARGAARGTPSTRGSWTALPRCGSERARRRRSRRTGSWHSRSSILPRTPKVVIYPIGPGDPRFLETPGLTVQAAAWLPDGNRLLLSANEAGPGNPDVSLRDRHPEEPRPDSGGLSVGPRPESHRTERSSSSPDRIGSLISIRSKAESRHALSIDPRGCPIGWSADGGSLFLRRRGEIPMRSSAPGPEDRGALAASSP